MKFILVLIMIMFIACSVEQSESPKPSIEIFEVLLQKSLMCDALDSIVSDMTGNYGSPLIVTYSDNFWKDPYPHVLVHQIPINFMDRFEADSIGINNYLWITDYIALDTTARIMMTIFPRKIYIGLYFEKVNGEWAVFSTYADSL